jgi:hypothetical protein
MKKNKKPRRLKNPTTQKQVRVTKGFDSGDTELPTWRVGTLDLEGPWGWKNLDCNTVWNQIHKKIKSFETMTWAAIQEAGSHNVLVSKFCPVAKKRLREIELDDLDELFSLHLSGKPRIWGIRDRHILRLLWWDPEHQVCPSFKKHT